MYLQKGFALLITNGNLNYDIVSGKDVTIRVSTNWSWRSVTGSQTVTHWTLGQCHTLTLLHTGHWDSVTGSHCYTLDTETVSQAHILLHTGHWDSVTGSHCYTLDTETVSQAHIVTHWTLTQCHRLTLLHTGHWDSVTGSHTVTHWTLTQCHRLRLLHCLWDSCWHDLHGGFSGSGKLSIGEMDHVSPNQSISGQCEPRRALQVCVANSRPEIECHNYCHRGPQLWRTRRCWVCTWIYSVRTIGCTKTNKKQNKTNKTDWRSQSTDS